MPISLGQLDLLLKIIREDENLSKHFELENAWDLFKNITDKQKRYFYFLILNKKYMKLNEFLISLGFKQKK